MANHHAPVAASQEDIQRAQNTWINFTKVMKVSVIAAVLILSFMALTIA